MFFSAKKSDDRNAYKKRKTVERSPVYTVHARAAERRNESMHKAGAIVLLIAAVGGMGWLIFTGVGQIKQWLFVKNDKFMIEHLDVSSTGTLSPEHVEQFGGFSIGQNLFDIDIASIRKKLEDGPLIKSAEVQRKLPSTLLVRVNERTPLARIEHGQAGFFFAVDLDGHVLGLAGKRMSAMPIVKGFSDRGISPGSVLRDGGAMDALQVIEMCDASPMSQAIHITAIDVSNPDYLDMSLDSGVKVLLPRNPPRSKLESLVDYLREANGRLKYFDLTLDRNIPAS
jgi:cell division protein FtsQ